MVCHARIESYHNLSVKTDIMIISADEYKMKNYKYM